MSNPLLTAPLILSAILILLCMASLGVLLVIIHNARQVLSMRVRIEHALSGVDQARIDALEEWARSGTVDLGLELDGGVYLHVALVGGPEVELRNKNTVSDAIDEIRKHPDFSL